MRKLKHQLWYQNKVEEKKIKKIQDLEKNYEEQKQKEKKQLDAEICYDNWIKKTMEQDLIKQDIAQRK